MEMPIPRKLALAVIEQALQDLVKPLACKRESKAAATKDATDFIFNPERKADLKFWLDMAGLRYDPFVRRAKEIQSQQIDISVLKEEIIKRPVLSAESTDQDTVH